MKRRALLISSVLPWPLHRNGGAQRTHLLRQALAHAGFEVDVLGVIPQPSPPLPAEPDQRRHGVVRVFPLSMDPPHRRSFSGPLGMPGRIRRQWRYRYARRSEVSHWVESRRDEYDLIMVRYLQTALVCGLDRRDPAAPPHVVVDLDDIDWLTLQSRFEAEPWPGLGGKIGMAAALHEVKGRCLRALPAFNLLYVASDADATALRRRGVQSVVLPNIPFVDESDPERLDPLPPAPDSRQVLFIGDLQFGPNSSGLGRFLTECWPAVQSRVPSAQLRVAGRGLSEEKRIAWSAHPGVHILGFVENVRAEYARCACTIAPLWWGGGTKIKVLESVALGRPVVATAHAARGYEVLAKRGGPVLVGESSERLTEMLMSLLTDHERIEKLAAVGPALAREHFGPRRFQTIVAASLASIPGDGGTPLLAVH